MTGTNQTFAETAIRVGQVFTPSAPIDQASLFAGRKEQLKKIFDAIAAKGQHVVLYGERGVGKTSLAATVSLGQPGTSEKTIPVRQNCCASDTYGKVWSRAFAGVSLALQKNRIGFAAETVSEVTTLARLVKEDPSPADVIAALRRFSAKVVFVFDEFDTIADKSVAAAFSETIKALSDFAVPSTVVVVGVGDSVDSLIASHASIERAIVQVLLPRMKAAELAEIIDKSMVSLEAKCDEIARDRIVHMSQGLPHYVHLLGLHAMRSALEAGSMYVTAAHVAEAIGLAISNASQTVVDAYLRAVSSPQKSSLFKQVLLACALASTDELGFFTPASVRRGLDIMGIKLDMSFFTRHLNKFSDAERGSVLQRVGANRCFRYRFGNPLLQPFVVMRGLTENLIYAADLDRLLSVRVA